MILDASAVIAIIHGEPEAAEFSRLIEAAESVSISAANWLEAALVVDGSRNAILSRRFDDVLAIAGVAVEPVTEKHARLARLAYRDFGKGSGHPARLNFGDCFAYALAKSSDAPLLFKGNDFGHTDIVPARPSP
jgi:ribonuclease VapC